MYVLQLIKEVVHALVLMRDTTEEKKNTFPESLSCHRKGQVLELSRASALISGVLPDGVGFLHFRAWGLNCLTVNQKG